MLDRMAVNSSHSYRCREFVMLFVNVLVDDM